MAGTRDLKGSRRELALVLADGRWRTANETARAMGKATGSIFGVLRRMHAEGLLKADTDEPIRGTQYRLTTEGKAALDEALADAHAVGQLAPSQWLMVVERGTDGPTLSDFERVLSRLDVSGSIAWATALGWGWLLVFAPETDEFVVQRLAVAFEAPGFRCRHANANALLSGADLRDWASTLTQEVRA